jgi:hypothetical protein
LPWQDVSFADSMIHVRRTWTCEQVGLPKSKASKGPVPLHPLLAEFILRWKQNTPYSQPAEWVFPSIRLEGHPHQDRSENGADATSAQRRQTYTSVLHPRGESGSHGGSRKNAGSDSQSCDGSKRTESGPRKDRTSLSCSPSFSCGGSVQRDSRVRTESGLAPSEVLRLSPLE